MLSNTQTIALYLFVFISVLVLSLLAQVSKEKLKASNLKKNKHVWLLPYSLAFIVLFVFLFFSDSGPDYLPYYTIINRVDWANYASFVDLEAGFNVVILLLKAISGGNADVVIALIKTITLVVVFVSFYILSDEINICFSLCSYVFLCYLRSFYLLPMLLAASIILLANAIFVKRDKIFIPLLLVLLSAQIHNAAYFYLFVFLISVLLKKVRSLSSVIKPSLVIFAMLLFLLSSYVFNLASILLPNFHYSSYQKGINIDLGIFWFVYSVPLALLVYYLGRSKKNSFVFDMIFVYMVFIMLIKALTYSFDVVGRLEFFLMPFYCVFVSIFINNQNFLSFSSKDEKAKIFFSFAYLLFVFVFIFMNDLQYMGNYNFNNPFAI